MARPEVPNLTELLAPVFGALPPEAVPVLLAGLELRPAQLASASKEAFFIALGGLLLPLGLGLALGWAVLPESELRSAQALFLGTALAITAVRVLFP